MESSKEEKPYSVGAYLKSQREKKGFSLQRIHEKTRIRPEVLKNIEAGENLPAPAYLVGFLKTYIRALDLDEAKLLRDFYKEKPKKKPSPEKNSSKDFSFFLKEKGVFFIISICLFALAAFFLFKSLEVKEISEQKEESNKPENQMKSKQREKKMKSDSQVKNKKDPALKKSPLKGKELIDEIRRGAYSKTLVIQSTADTVMYFKTDGKETVTKPLKKNVWYIIKARDKIYVRVDGRSYLHFIYEGRLFSVSSTLSFERVF